MKRYIFFLIFCFIYSIYINGQSNCDTIIFNSYGSKIRGYFYASQNFRSPTLIFTQAFFSTGDIWNLGKTFSEKGINVFMFDFRGCFKSEGKQGLKNSQEDISSALALLKADEMITNYNIDTSNIILGGYSYGGHMSMLFAINHPEIKRVTSISGGDLGILCDLLKTDTSLYKGYSVFFQSLEKPNGPVEFEYNNPINELIENQDYFYLLKQTKKLSNTDVLITGGLDDNTVSLEKMILPMYRILKKNKDQKVKCIIYQTNHSYENVSSNLLDDIINWIKRKRI